MKNLLLCLVVALLSLPSTMATGQSAGGVALAEQMSVNGGSLDNSGPELSGLQFVTQLPSELPQRVSGFAFDGERFWIMIYHGEGRYAIFDPLTNEWTASSRDERHQAMREVAIRFGSPGGICFVNDRLWIGGSYGESFGAINLGTWRVDHLFRGRYRADAASQSYAGMAYDGRHLWIAWHWFKYDLPTAQTQLLLQTDPETGRVVREFPAPAGTRNDMTHGLTWDGSRLWHMKDSQLSAIDSVTGQITAQHTLPGIRRASGLAWDGKALWIIEFKGTVWRLPFRSREQKLTDEEAAVQQRLTRG